MTGNKTSLKEMALTAVAIVALAFILLLLSPIIVPVLIIGFVIQMVQLFGQRFLGWPEPKPITRTEAADLLDEFARLSGHYYSDDFELPLGDKFEDPLLQSVTKEFFEIMQDYETNCKAYNGVLPEKSVQRLHELSAMLREHPEPSGDGVPE
jgi:hypothetical protein